jgi:hypothetical protein
MGAVAELSAAEQAARVCAYLMPERMLALLEAELEKAVQLELDVTSIALPAERRWRGPTYRLLQQRLLERLGRRTNALTNFSANLGIVLCHLQNGVVFL